MLSVLDCEQISQLGYKNYLAIGFLAQ